MKLPQIKEELKKRGIVPSYKDKKADLQRLLRDAVKGSILFFKCNNIVLVIYYFSLAKQK